MARMEGKPVVRLAIVAVIVVASLARADAPPKSPDVEEVVLVPAGELAMGHADGMAEEQPVHRVHVSAFWMDRHEVTNRRFRAFADATGYRTDAEREGGGHWHDGKAWAQDPRVTWRSPFKPGDTLTDKLDLPAVQVTWNDAAAFAKWAGKRLPTEAEWERAARAGLESKKYPWGDEGARGKACYGQNSATGRPMPVGSFPPNALGLFDMSGNVFEWCSDWFDEGYYKASPPRDPPGPAGGTYKVVRGGAWENSGNLIRCAYRDFNVPARRLAINGFRCAATPAR